MPKRGRSSSSSGRKKSKSRSRSRSHNRKGYGSVARSRGAAVTGETKYFDCERQATAIPAVTTTWVATTIADPTSTINLGDAAVATPGCLFVPKPSASLNGRIGRKVAVLSIKVRGQVYTGVNNTLTQVDIPTKVRVLLVLDKQTNSSQMLPAALLNDAGQAATTINSYMNPNNFGRFQVLKDMVFDIHPIVAVNNAAATTVSDVGNFKPFKMSHKFKPPLVCDFNVTNGGNVGDIIDNSFHIIAGANNATIVPTLAYYSRVSYKDA